MENENRDLATTAESSGPLETCHVCQWCGEKFPESELQREADLGLLCARCIKALLSRGEKLVLLD